MQLNRRPIVRIGSTGGTRDTSASRVKLVLWSTIEIDQRITLSVVDGYVEAGKQIM